MTADQNGDRSEAATSRRAAEERETNMKTKRISREIAKTGRTGQTVDLVEVLTHYRARLKISIRSCAYDFQSYARISRWDGSEWKLLHSLIEMSTKTGLGYKKVGATFEDFAADHTELLRVAGEVLS